MFAKVLVCIGIVAQVLGISAGLPSQTVGIIRVQRSADPHGGIFGLLGGGGGYGGGGYGGGGGYSGYPGGYGGGASQANAAASAGSVGGGYPGGYGGYPGGYGGYPGGYGGYGGSQSQAEANSFSNSQSFGLGPLQATFSQSGAHAESSAGSGGYY